MWNIYICSHVTMSGFLSIYHVRQCNMLWLHMTQIMLKNMIHLRSHGHVTLISNTEHVNIPGKFHVSHNEKSIRE